MRGVWHKVKVPGHVAEVLKAVQRPLTVDTLLAAGAVAILAAADPAAKAALSRALAAPGPKGRWRSAVPRRRRGPARPERPLLRPPRDMPKRRAISARAPGGSRCCTRSRISSSTRSISPGTSSRALPASGLPRDFFDDWVGVAAEEAGHFALLAARLAALGAPMAICRRMTGCGKRRRRPRTTCSRGSRSCRWCSKRAGST